MSGCKNPQDLPTKNQERFVRLFVVCQSQTSVTRSEELVHFLDLGVREFTKCFPT